MAWSAETRKKALETKARNRAAKLSAAIEADVKVPLAQAASRQQEPPLVVRTTRRKIQRVIPRPRQPSGKPESVSYDAPSYDELVGDMANELAYSPDIYERFRSRMTFVRHMVQEHYKKNFDPNVKLRYVTPTRLQVMRMDGYRPVKSDGTDGHGPAGADVVVNGQVLIANSVENVKKAHARNFKESLHRSATISKEIVQEKAGVAMPASLTSSVEEVPGRLVKEEGNAPIQFFPS